MKRTGDKTKYLSRQDFFALLAIGCGLVFFFLKCPYGFGMDDESFYITIPMRLIHGESLLTDEWHVSQLSALFLYLPVKLYLLIKGSTEGILLFFRYLFIVMQGAMGTVIYCKLRKYGPCSIFAALIYFLHIPLTYMNINYNSLGLAFVTLIGLMLATREAYSKPVLYFTGIFAACSVLCNPILAGVYILYCVCVLIRLCIKKKAPDKSFYHIKSWLWITLGILTMLILFVIFLLTRTTFKEILDNLPHLFTDPEYRFTETTFGEQNIFNFKESFLAVIDVSPYLLAVYAVLTLVIVFDKKRTAHRIVYLPLATLLFIGLILTILCSETFFGYGFWMFPLTLFGLSCYLLTENKNKNMFRYLWIFGVVYALCLDISSDVGPKGATLALAASDIASILFIKDVCDEMKNEKQKFANTIKAVCIASLALQIGLQCFIGSNFKKICSEYVSESTSVPLNVKLDRGPEKGLITTEKRAEIYYDTLHDLDQLKAMGSGRFLVTENLPWCYLYADMPYATFSTWIIGDRWFADKAIRLPEYYALHPDKKPKFIYVPKRNTYYYRDVDEFAKKVAADLQSKYTCTVTEGREGYILSVH